MTSYTAPVAGSHSEEETFYRNCRAAYLAVFRSSLVNISSKEELCLGIPCPKNKASQTWQSQKISSDSLTVLQQAGRNPSRKVLGKYWTPRTTKLNFDDFCEILKKEKPTEESDLIKAFRTIDLNSDGYVTHSELFEVLTSRGEKMSPEEVNKIFSLADSSRDGKLDYSEFCRLVMSTSKQCHRAALKILEADIQSKRQNLGSESRRSPKSLLSHVVSPEEGTSQKTGQETTPRKGCSWSVYECVIDCEFPVGPRRITDPFEGGVAKNRSAHPPWARGRRSSVSSTFTMGASSTRSGKLIEPKSLQEWHHISSKGCFFLEEDGGIPSLQYRLHIPQTSVVYLTIKPLNLSLTEEKPSPWMTVDTALFLVNANEKKEDSNLVCFTDVRDKEKFGWKGELSAGVYYLLPFTTGCRLKKRKKPVNKQVQLVYRTDRGELALTKEFKTALSDIFEVIDLDGNGLLSLEEYNFFEQRTSGEKCDEEAWAVCRENFDTKKNELTRQGFMELNLMEATDREGDPADLWITLESMGYNRALEMVEACPFIIDVYSEECKPTVKPVSLDSGSKILNTAVYRSVIAKGEAKPIKGYENIIIYTYKSDMRISSVIANKSNSKVTVHVNNEQSKNCSSSRGMNVFAVEVPPRTKVVCQHVMPVNERQEWTYNCVESILP